MANNQESARDTKKQGSSLSRSTKRQSDVTDEAIHPKSDEAVETVDQDPGERQKENQNQQKEDPLAA